jgi:hypothetical protein
VLQASCCGGWHSASSPSRLTCASATRRCIRAYRAFSTPTAVLTSGAQLAPLTEARATVVTLTRQQDVEVSARRQRVEVRPPPTLHRGSYGLTDPRACDTTARRERDPHR